MLTLTDKREGDLAAVLDCDDCWDVLTLSLFVGECGAVCDALVTVSERVVDEVVEVVEDIDKLGVLLDVTDGLLNESEVVGCCGLEDVFVLFDEHMWDARRSKTTSNMEL